MENGAISDGQISASSSYDGYHAARLARLHYKGGGGYAGAWETATGDTNQYLQIDLSSHYIKINRVATQGRHDESHWVTTYNLRYRKDEESFQDYIEQGQSVKKVN